MIWAPPLAPLGLLPLRRAENAVGAHAARPTFGRCHLLLFVNNFDKSID
jgi:hypothetical protein